MKWIELNNQVVIRDDNGRLQLDKDKESLKAYLDEHIEPKTYKFSSLKERIDFLVENNYYSKDVINSYTFSQIEELNELINKQDFKFQSMIKNTYLKITTIKY